MTQPTALFLADILEDGGKPADIAEKAAVELRRLHAELERCKQVCAATAEGWRSDAALAEPVQEPVAWLWRHRETGRTRLLMPNERTATDVAAAFDVVGPLYLAPPQRKPEPNSDYERGFVDGMSEQARRSVDKAVNAMTKCKPLAEEQIARLVTNDMVKFARAIEQAHGIKENT